MCRAKKWSNDNLPSLEIPRYRDVVLWKQILQNHKNGVYSVVQWPMNHVFDFQTQTLSCRLWSKRPKDFYSVLCRPVSSRYLVTEVAPGVWYLCCERITNFYPWISCIFAKPRHAARLRTELVFRTTIYVWIIREKKSLILLIAVFEKLTSLCIV